MCTISKEKMQEYYANLDPLVFKYKNFLLIKEIDGKGQKENKVDDYAEKYLNFQKYEEARQFSEFTKKDYRNLHANLELAYGNRELADEYLGIYDMICDKIICRYLNIDGMESLFSERYADFEWEMHLGIDYRNHKRSFYRDHFVHQIRDAYSMVVLMEEMGFYDKVKTILEDEGNGKVSRYACKMIRQQLQLPLRNYFVNCEEEDLKDHFIYNVIYMACYMAGLFHDIGYPTGDSLGEHRKMSDYLVEAHYFEGGTYDFIKIASLLQSSLLFRVVPATEIRKRIESEKPDHGVLSALLFLLHFYENGAIYRQEPYKLCAIELAGLAIYNHTNQYASLGQKEPHYERCVFSQNPISYILRVCDDLQEWERIYFEISKSSNLILCNQCHLPIVRKEKVSVEERYQDVEYRCGCKESDALFEPAFHYGQFPYRRIYNVTVCTEMRIETRDNYNYDIFLDYKLGRLLHVAYINPEYARYRTKELLFARKLFLRQSYLGKVYVDYFVTSNVILIKAKIIGKYLENTAGKPGKDVLCVIQNMLAKIIQKNPKHITKGEVWAHCEDIFENSFREMMVEEKGDFEGYLKEAFCTYIFVYYLMRLAVKANAFACPDKEAAVKNITEIMQSLGEQSFYEKDAKILLKDCGEQICRMYDKDIIKGYPYYPEPYFELFYSKENYYQAVMRFVDLQNYNPRKWKGNPVKRLDAFSDLYYIRKLICDEDL